MSDPVDWDLEKHWRDIRRVAVTWDRASPPTPDPNTTTTWVRVDSILVTDQGVCVTDTGLIHCTTPHIRDLIDHPQYEPDGRIPW